MGCRVVRFGMESFSIQRQRGCLALQLLGEGGALPCLVSSQTLACSDFALQYFQLLTCFLSTLEALSPRHIDGFFPHAVELLGQRLDIGAQVKFGSRLLWRWG